MINTETHCVVCGSAMQDLDSEVIPSCPQCSSKHTADSTKESNERLLEAMDSIAYKKKQTVYLAGPMRGHHRYNVDKFCLATEDLREKGYEVINPHEEDLKAGFNVYDLPRVEGKHGSLCRACPRQVVREARNL